MASQSQSSTRKNYRPLHVARPVHPRGTNRSEKRKRPESDNESNRRMERKKVAPDSTFSLSQSFGGVATQYDDNQSESTEQLSPDEGRGAEQDPSMSQLTPPGSQERSGGNADKQNADKDIVQKQKGRSKVTAAKRDAFKEHDIRLEDRQLLLRTRLTLMSRLVSGEIYLNVRLNVWTDVNSSLFSSLVQDSWILAQNTDRPLQEGFSPDAYAGVLSYMAIEVNTFKNNVMARVRRIYEGLYGLAELDVEAARERAAWLVKDFAYIATNPHNPTRQQFLNKGIAKVMARCLYGRTKDDLAETGGPNERFEPLTGSAICFYCALIHWGLDEFSRGGKVIPAEKLGIERVFQTLLSQWDENMPTRRAQLARLLKAKIQACTDRNISEKKLPIAANPYKDTLDDLVNNGDDGEDDFEAEHPYTPVQNPTTTRDSRSNAQSSPTQENSPISPQAPQVQGLAAQPFQLSKENISGSTASRPVARKKTIPKRKVSVKTSPTTTKTLMLPRRMTLIDLREMCGLRDDHHQVWIEDTILDDDQAVLSFLDNLHKTKGDTGKVLSFHGWPTPENDDGDEWFCPIPD